MDGIRHGQPVTTEQLDSLVEYDRRQVECDRRHD